MKRFYFHLAGDGRVERDEEGIPCVDLEHAYLEACGALPDVAAEILRSRKDPMSFSFLVENEDHVPLLTIPFDELIAGHRRAPSALRADQPPPALRGTSDLQSALADGDARIARQRDVVARLLARGLDTALANRILEMFEEAQSILRIDAGRRPRFSPPTRPGGRGAG